MYLISTDKIFLEAAHACETRQQIGANGFVIGAASSNSTERLVTNDGATAFAVDTEIARRLSQPFLGDLDCLSVGSKDESSKSEAGRVLDDRQQLFKLVIRVDEDGKDWTEKFNGHERMLCILCLENRGCDKPTFASVGRSASEEFDRLVSLGLRDYFVELCPRTLMNHRTDEVVKLVRISDFEFRSLFNQLWLLVSWLVICISPPPLRREVWLKMQLPHSCHARRSRDQKFLESRQTRARSLQHLLFETKRAAI